MLKNIPEKSSLFSWEKTILKDRRKKPMDNCGRYKSRVNESGTGLSRKSTRTHGSKTWLKKNSFHWETLH